MYILLVRVKIFYVNYIMLQIWCISDKSWTIWYGIYECTCGTPVIGANSGGPMDFVDDNVGKLVDENDNDEILGNNFGEAIIKSIDNNDKHKKSNVCIKVAAPYAIKAKVEAMLKSTKQLYNL